MVWHGTDATFMVKTENKRYTYFQSNNEAFINETFCLIKVLAVNILGRFLLNTDKNIR
jgi:hypothetical protein